MAAASVLACLKSICEKILLVFRDEPEFCGTNLIRLARSHQVNPQSCRPSFRPTFLLTSSFERHTVSDPPFKARDGPLFMSYVL